MWSPGPRLDLLPSKAASIADRAPDGRGRYRVVIAGGGVAGLEAALSLSRHAPGLLEVEVVAPADEFVYRPLLVAEPFGVEARIRFDLERLVSLAGARLRRDAVVEVRAAERMIDLESGAELSYDALLVALGARPRDSVDGAVSFGSDAGREVFADLLERIGRPGWSSVAFVVPPAATWTIAAYELAMLTAAEVRYAVSSAWRSPWPRTRAGRWRRSAETCPN